MTIKVKWSERCLNQLEAWMAQRTRTRIDAELHLERQVDLIEAELIRFRGHPPGSFSLSDLHPMPIVWEVVRGQLWLVFVLRHQGNLFRRMLGFTHPDIVLCRICEQRPDAKTLLLPPS